MDIQYDLLIHALQACSTGTFNSYVSDGRILTLIDRDLISVEANIFTNKRVVVPSPTASRESYCRRAKPSGERYNSAQRDGHGHRCLTRSSHGQMGAFRTTPAQPHHQLIATLPIHFRLQMLSKTAALTLLTVPHSSQLIQCLGLPWCNADELEDDLPLTPHPTPSTPLTRLAALVPHESRRPVKDHPNQHARLPPHNNRLHSLEAIPRARTGSLYRNKSNR